MDLTPGIAEIKHIKFIVERDYSSYSEEDKKSLTLLLFDSVISLMQRNVEVLDGLSEFLESVRNALNDNI